MAGALYRIGFPFAKPSEDHQEAWVELAPSHMAGFREVYHEEQRYALAPEDVGPKILDRLEGRGCVGLLHQWGEGKGILDHRSGRLLGQGRSMQLALVLAVFADPQGDAPLMLCSGAIDHPFGHPPFQGARIMPYADGKIVEADLLAKFRCAQCAGAVALALPMRDAMILKEALSQNGETVSVLKAEQLKSPPQSLSLVALSDGDLAKFASVMGIANGHFTVAVKTSWPWGRVLAVGAAVTFLISLWIIRQSAERAEAFLKHRRELISKIYSTEEGSIHRRLRDECLKEFLLLERQENGQKTLQNESRSRRSYDERIDLKEVQLSLADLHRCDLSNINFLNADLSEANLNRSQLQGCYFKGTQFKGAHLYMADLSFSVLSNANFESANLRGADFTGTVGLDLASLRGASFDERTIWPNGWDEKRLAAKGAILLSTESAPVFDGPEKTYSR